MATRFAYTVPLFLLLVFGCAPRIARARGVAEGTFQRTLTVAGPVDLEVSTGAGHIDIKPGTSGRVEVRAMFRISERSRSRRQAESVSRQLQSNPPIEQNGNTIRIGRINDSEARHNVTISYDISVPAATQLRSRTGSGDQSERRGTFRG